MKLVNSSIIYTLQMRALFSLKWRMSSVLGLTMMDSVGAIPSIFKHKTPVVSPHKMKMGNINNFLRLLNLRLSFKISECIYSNILN